MKIVNSILFIIKNAQFADIVDFPKLSEQFFIYF